MSAKNISSLPHDKHDNFVRSMMAEPKVLKNFVQCYLPQQLLKDVDLESMELLSEHVISKRLRKYLTDLVVKVKKSNKDAYFYCVVEFKSTPDKLSALQAMSYALQLMLKFADLKKDKPAPLVYPVILYHGKTKFKHSTDPRDAIEATKDDVKLMWNKVQLIDVSVKSDDEILHSSEFPFSFMQLVLKHVYDDDLLQTLKDVKEFLRLYKKYTFEFGRDKGLIILQYLYASGNINDDDYFAEIMAAIDPVIGEEAMTLQQIHEQRGEQRGIPKGIQIGEERGIQIGEERTTISIVKKMLALGEPIEKIAMVCGLSIQKIDQLLQVQVESVA